ncbi:MAG: hypothetical protein K2I42_00720 [Anaeroplasmataceae bacterium]|nr:hypothetical protein [Anaeroplasmataceae bacterium]
MNPFLGLAIAIIVLLVVLFIVTYILNKRTPVPKGCEQIKISEEFCLNCTNTDCKIHEKLDLEKVKKELESEDEE